MHTCAVTLKMLCFDGIPAAKEMSVESFAQDFWLLQLDSQALDVAVTDSQQSAYVRSMQSHTDSVQWQNTSVTRVPQKHKGARILIELSDSVTHHNMT